MRFALFALLSSGCGLPRTELHVMDADGTADRVLLTSTLSVEPRWGPEKIVFMSQLNGKGVFDVFTIDVDGTGLRQLTHGSNGGDPTWSPDGKQITFGSDREGGDKLNVFIMNADGSNQRALTSFAPPVEAGDTNWAPDGARVVFERDVGGKKQSDPNAPAEVWTIGADGSGAVSTKQACDDVGCAPRFSPDGKQIAFVHEHHVFVMNADGSGAHRVTTFAETEDSPWWAPDGKSLLMVRGLDGAAIYRVDVDGSHAVRLSPSNARDVFPVFSPDGAQLAFARLLSDPP